MSSQPKVALVHDDFVQNGGAESLFATIASLFADAPIYTSLIDWKKFEGYFDGKRVKTSFMQKIPFAKHFFKALLPLYPFAFESFDFSEFDVVISSTTRFAKSIITKPETVHICYTNSLPRFLYDRNALEEYLPKSLIFLLSPYLSWLKRWDIASAQRVDVFIANSINVQKKLKDTYGVNSKVVYPFADLDFFKIPKLHNWELKSQNYFLIVSRLVKWKKIDIAIAAAIELEKTLFIVGDGPDKKRLQRLAKGIDFIKILGKVEKARLLNLYQNCKGLIVTQQEDFGISQVEAQACGKPVIAYNTGGQKEIITKNSGIFFAKQTKDSLIDAINAFTKVKWSEAACRRQAQEFTKDKFVNGLLEAVKTNVKGK